MPSKVGHVVRLVPIAIGGTYSAYPSFLPTEPKDIESLFEERKCYMVAHSEKKSQNGGAEKEKYLLACRTHPVGKTLDFFFFDSSRKITFPVKNLKISPGGGEDKGKTLNLDFTWGNSSSFEAQPFIFNTPFFELSESKPKDLYLTTLCEDTLITKLSEHTNSKEVLKCSWKDQKGREWQDFWRSTDKNEIFPLPPPPWPAEPSS